MDQLLFQPVCRRNIDERPCTARGFWDSGLKPTLLSMRLKVSRAVFSRAEEAVGFDQPGRIVALGEPEQRLSRLLDGLESAQPRQVFLAGADEALGTAIAFRCPDEGGRTRDAEEGDCFLDLAGPVRRSVVAGHRRSAGDRLGEPARMLPYALQDRLQGLERGGACMRVDAGAFGRAMIARNQYR